MNNPTPEQVAKERAERITNGEFMVRAAFLHLGIGEPVWKDNRYHGHHCVAERWGQEVLIQVTSTGRVEVEGVDNRTVAYDDSLKLAKSIEGRWKRALAAEARETARLKEQQERNERARALHAEALTALKVRLGEELADRAAYVSTTTTSSGAVRCDITVYASSPAGSKVKAICVSAEEAAKLVEDLQRLGWTFPTED